ncbi:hypothetical protein J437_LFUL009234 [Ladona fulva]|uniref:Chitin-binding type-2 domain-containing protein n=1 Tax=Ladona fulva TaxID=123851 RepID=A0A8K0K682_LADFU|nr:hypothetical protein J437_LFUL009234 [Ladona fulva]
MGGATMTILLALLVIGTVSSRTLDNWNIETSCPLTARPTYQPHPLNCNFYLFCTGNSLTPFLQRCPRGQVFDRNLGYCSDSSEAKCIEYPISFRANPIQIMDVKPNDLPCTQSDYIRYVAHPANCSRFFECSMAQVTEMECPSGLHFLPHLESCGTSPLTCGVSLNSHNNRIKRECQKIAPPKCPTINMGYGLRLPHQNCDSFYQCMHGVPVMMRCPPGLHFNSFSQECDFPGRLECNRCPSIDGVGEAENEEQLILCPKHYGFQGNIRHPKHCDRFYSCSSGYPVQRKCPLGLLFNPVMQKCDWPTSVKCPNNNLDGVQGPGVIDGGINQCHTYENCKHGSLLPDSSDCSSFYQCVWGQPVHMKCPDDLYFNPKLQVCDWPWNVECEDDSSSSSSDSSSSSSSEGDDSDENEGDTKNPDPDFGLEELSSETGEEDQEEGHPAGVPAKPKKIMKPAKCPLVERSHECEMPKCPPYNYGYVVQFFNPFNCSEFFKCNWGEAVKFSCSSGLYYNRRLQVCDYPETAECLPCDDKESVSSKNHPVNAHRKGSLQKYRAACKSELTSLPDPDACGSYYKCQDGELTKKACPKGLHFNPVLKVCDFPRNALCRAYRESQSSSCPEIDSNACSLGREGIFVNPKDCSSYYKCEKGTLSLKVCPEGLEFNAIMKMCDQPQNARCKQCVEGREKRAECSSSLYGQSAVLPDPNNCNAYYRCEWGAMVPYKCPDGLHFNSILEVCDLPERSRCKK